MPLRVLLADESTTIKKVFKWALQDYGAEIFTVLTDDTFISSIHTLKPDIIFLDSLLKGKNGYLLSHEIKSNPNLAPIPIVILWNHFVPLDPVKFKNSKANAHLEKPFSVMSLREKVQKWVPKLKTQALSQHLTFPENEDLHPHSNIKKESLDKTSDVHSNLSDQQEKKETSHSSDSMRNLLSKELNLEENPLNQDLSDIKENEISLKDFPQEKEEELLTLEEEDDWVQKNVFKIEDPSSLLEDEESEKKLFFDKAITDLKPSETTVEEPSETEAHLTSSQDLNPEEIKADLKEEKEFFLKDFENPSSTSEGKKIQDQSKKIIESIAWKIVPELASQIIEKEIKRLLSEKEEDP